MATLPPTLRIEELESGNEYGYVIPTVSRMVLSGYFPAPAKRIAQEFLSGKIEADQTLSDDDIKAWESFRSSLVAWMIRQVDGEDVELTADEVDDPEQFPSDDRDALYLRAIKMVPAPKATKVAPKEMATT